MKVFHIRIDDRLIHGQVLVGWGIKFQYQAYIICDEALASSDWEKEIYLASVPPDITGKVLTPEELSGFPENAGFERIMLLFRSLAELKKSVDIGFKPREVILGGLHDKERRKRVFDYLYLSAEDMEILKALMEKGIHFVAQDLPDHPAHDLNGNL